MIRQWLCNQADDTHEGSFSYRQRQRRFAAFDAFTADLPRPLKILDIGGTNDYWEQRGWHQRDDVTITLLNPDAEEQRFANIVPVVGDGCDLSAYETNSIGLVFSNSVIEHLFTLDRQRQMAAEIRRVGRAYWIQTPNFWFPIEPHFLAPGWQYLPVSVRVAILQRRSVGWAAQCDHETAEQVVRTIRLLRRRELAGLFPDGALRAEKLGGLVKSWTAVAA